MTGRVTSVLRLRSLHVALLAAILLIIGGTQASADPGKTRFKIAWSNLQEPCCFRSLRTSRPR